MTGGEEPGPKSCGFLIIRGRPIDEFLLMEHADRLDLPKGHTDAGEDELGCALRELQEETGIGAQDIELLDGFRFQTHYEVRSRRTNFQPRQKQLVVFLARLRREVNIAPSEHLGYRWVRWQPPHHLQTNTIDPLLAEVQRYFEQAAGTG